MVVEAKKKYINRLNSLLPLRAKINETYKKSLEAIKMGKPVAWAMINAWYGDPILKALELETLYPENFGAICASEGVAESYLDRAEKDGFPSHLCGYARNCIGYVSKMVKELGGKIPTEAPMGGMPKPIFLLSSNIGCDARYKWFQALGKYLDVPVWVLDMPIPGVKEFFRNGVYERCIKFIIEELKEFVQFLERILGQKMNWDRLEKVVYEIEELNKVWFEINELRKAIPCPMHSRDFWSAMPSSLFLAGEPSETVILYKGMLEEVRQRVILKVSSINTEEKFRILFSELPPWHNLSIFEEMAERGWNFVIESWGYHPPPPLNLKGISDPLERIARFSFHFHTAYFKDALSEGEYYGYMGYPLLKFAKEYKCDGAFFHLPMTCRSTSTHQLYIKEKMEQRLKIPSMIVQGDIVDLRLFNQAEVINQMEPFEESMKYFKKLRE